MSRVLPGKEGGGRTDFAGWGDISACISCFLWFANVSANEIINFSPSTPEGFLPYRAFPLGFTVLHSCLFILQISFYFLLRDQTVL